MARRRAVAFGILLAVSPLTTSTLADDDWVRGSQPTSTSFGSMASAPPADRLATAATSPPPASADAPASAALDEVLRWLGDPALIRSDGFAAEFLDRVPIERVKEVFESLGVGRWQASGVSLYGPDQLIAHLSGPGSPQIVQVAVDSEGRITELVFQPEPSDPPASLGELTQRLATIGETSVFLRAAVSADGSCEPEASLDADRVVPIGSTFKLYVLGAVVTAIEQGRFDWETEVPIRDELDSLPSGVTQDDPAGTSLWVLDLAQRMIAISDNTATDHLIDLVGRDAVEVALVDFGHSDPGATLPFLTTREAFVIKGDDDLLGRYEPATEAERRALLADEVATAPLPELDALWTEPRAIDTVEWFASPADTCRALVKLDDLTSTPGLEPIADVLGANPGAIIDPNEYPRVFFKGGSEPGVFFAAWLAERPDNTRVVVAGGVADTNTSIERDPTLIQLFARGLTLN